MTMRRWSLALLAATCVGALAVGAATATPPERVPLIIDDTEIEGACAFLVGVEIIANTMPGKLPEASGGSPTWCSWGWVSPSRTTSQWLVRSAEW